MGGAVICEEFLRIWSDAGCRMAEMAPESTPINTKGYESLLQLVANTTGDSFDLYSGLFYYNAYSKAQLEKLENALQKVKESLFAFESEQMKEDGGPEARWGRSSSSSQLGYTDRR